MENLPAWTLSFGSLLAQYIAILKRKCMHEMSVAQNILEIVRESVAASEKLRVQSVKLRIGQMSGIVRDSLEFCFTVLTEGTPFEGARLDIEESPTSARCNSCNRQSALEYGMFICPGCGSRDIAILTGTELQVVSLDLADRAEEDRS